MMTRLTRFRIVLLAVALASRCGVFAQSTAPVIDKVDPPNWWVQLPDPMLLLHGSELGRAHFNVSGKGVRLLRTQASANGHYAFLWLDTRTAAAQPVKITAASSAGEAHAAFELQARRPSQGRYQGFSSADVMYLIMTDRFADGDPSNNQPGYAPAEPRGWHGGDLRGIVNHLDYLRDLGVTTLWTTPVASNGLMPESYHGYAAVDLYAVDSHFGTLADYQHMAEMLHQRGMKLVMDIVPNHLGVQHPWVHDPPTPNWFHGTFENHTHVRFNFEALTDPHAAPASYVDITHGWFTDAMPDLNQENPLVSRYLIQNAIWWVESAGLDGLRIDTFPYVGRPFWHDFHQALHQLYPRLTTVGEVFNGDPTITSFFAGGESHEGVDTGLFTPFDFPTYFTLRDVLLHGKPMSALTSVWTQDHLYPHPERLVPFFGNHDTKRFLSEAGATPALLKLAFALVATMRGMPEIYSGDEIAMQGGDDPDNRRDFPGGFAGSTNDAFTAAGRTSDQQAMFSWVSQLLHMRATHPVLNSGDQQEIQADDTTLAFVRGEHLDRGCTSPGRSERILVVFSKAQQPRTLELNSAQTSLAGCTHWKPLFPSAAADVTMQAGKASIPLGPESVAIYSVE